MRLVGIPAPMRYPSSTACRKHRRKVTAIGSPVHSARWSSESVDGNEARCSIIGMVRLRQYSESGLESCIESIEIRGLWISLILSLRNISVA